MSIETCGKVFRNARRSLKMKDPASDNEDILRRNNLNKILIQAITPFSIYLLYKRSISQKYILVLQRDKNQPFLHGMYCCHKENNRLF